MVARVPLPRLALALLLPLAACHARDAAPPAEVAVAEADDFALAGGLAAPLMTDPALGEMADAAIAGRTPVPIQAGMPLARLTAPAVGPLLHAPPASPDREAPAPTITALAARHAGPACQAPLGYGAAWAARMPEALPVYPEGQVQQAAGFDSPACRLRIVRFTTAAASGDIIDYYYTRARRAGFDADHRLRGDMHVLAGSRAADGATYHLTAETAADATTSVDLLASGSR